MATLTVKTNDTRYIFDLEACENARYGPLYGERWSLPIGVEGLKMLKEMIEADEVMIGVRGNDENISYLSNETITFKLTKKQRNEISKFYNLFIEARCDEQEWLSELDDYYPITVINIRDNP